jgi:hypothetical protein
MIEWGIPASAAGAVAAGQGPEMGRALLALYRSVPEGTLVERGRNLPAADRADARAVDLDGLGHWWMLQEPTRSAAVLPDFWDSL